jgi:hypothetical protein
MADELSLASREFYERAKLKFGLSFFAAGFGLMLLGFCSTAGGLSSSYQIQKDQYVSQVGSSNADQKTLDYYSGLVGSYGISGFIFLVLI